MQNGLGYVRSNISTRPNDMFAKMICACSNPGPITINLHENAIYLIIIIIIIDFYGAYILRNLSSEAQQNRISRRNRKQGRAKVSIRTRDNRTFMVGMQFGIDMS